MTFYDAHPLAVHPLPVTPRITCEFQKFTRFCAPFLIKLFFLCGTRPGGRTLPTGHSKAPSGNPPSGAAFLRTLFCLKTHHKAPSKNPSEDVPVYHCQPDSASSFIFQWQPQCLLIFYGNRNLASSKPTRCKAQCEQVKQQSSPGRGYKFGCVCSCMAVLPRCEATNLGMFDLCHFDLPRYGRLQHYFGHTIIVHLQTKIAACKSPKSFTCLEQWCFRLIALFLPDHSS